MYWIRIGYHICFGYIWISFGYVLDMFGIHLDNLARMQDLLARAQDLIHSHSRRVPQQPVCPQRYGHVGSQWFEEA